LTLTATITGRRDAGSARTAALRRCASIGQKSRQSGSMKVTSTGRPRNPASESGRPSSPRSVKPGARRRRAGQVAAAVFAAGTAEDIGDDGEPEDVRTKPSDTAATTTSGTAANSAQRSTLEWYAQRLAT
jgi:hypothetical protein